MKDRESEWSELMRAAKAGDEAAYRRLLKSLAPALRASTRHGFLRAGLGGADVEDVVQETLLAVHLKRHTWRDSEKIGPWLRAIARNKLIDALRRQGRHASVPIDDFLDVLAAEEPRQSASVDEVERHLLELPAGQREVVRMIAVKGVGIGEVASVLRISRGAVRTALHRGLAALARKYRSMDR